MREIDEAVKATILRSFTNREIELAEANQRNRAHTWRWTDGVYLFPEGICPYCHAAIRSNRIWKVEGRQLTGVWRIGPTGQPVKVGSTDSGHDLHPHVNGNTICVGHWSSDDAASALWMGMYPAGSYRGSSDHWVPWLRQVWDHDCPGPFRRTAADCTHCCSVHCGEARCGVTWIGEVRGCLCGCACHPSRPCDCGHEQCGCPPHTMVDCAGCQGSLREVDAMTCQRCEGARYCQACYNTDHAAHNNACDRCGEFGREMASCCPGTCLVCHDGPTVEEGEDSDDGTFFCARCEETVDVEDTSYCEDCDERYCDDCFDAAHLHVEEDEPDDEEF